MNPFSCFAFALLCAVNLSRADSATWSATPTNGDWSTAANWTPQTVPNGASDTAMFQDSDVTELSISANVQLNQAIFSPGAIGFGITVSPGFTLSFGGQGVTNNSGVAQNFTVGADSVGNGHFAAIQFNDSASAGVMTAFHVSGFPGDSFSMLGGTVRFLNFSSADHSFFVTEGGGTATFGGETSFTDNSTAANATFVTNGSIVEGGFGGTTVFSGHATAANGNFTVNGATIANTQAGRTLLLENAMADHALFTVNGGTAAGALGGRLEFDDDATAAESTIVLNGGTAGQASGGGVTFRFRASAGNSTITANGSSDGGKGGSIVLLDDSTGVASRLELVGNGNLDISAHNPSAVGVGSIKGDGTVFLGAFNLIVGGNNLSTNFSGVLQDGGGSLGTGGSLTKIGTGTLTLAGANTYTGSTIVNAGTLMVNGTVSGPVLLNGGTLSGVGQVGGVTVNTGALLWPGAPSGIMEITGDVSFTTGSTFAVQLDGSALGMYGRLRVDGGVALNNATLSLNASFAPRRGTKFTIIDNDAGDQVVGTFSGLRQNAKIRINGHKFKINYRGGDGNDVVLTTVK